MDSTLDLLNYSPRIAMNRNDDDDNEGIEEAIHENTKYILNSKEETNLCSVMGTEESGFQEESEHWIHHPSKSYPGPEDPFESWFTSESDMLILYEIFGEFYDEEFEKLSYVEKKALKDKVAVSVPKSPEELMKMYPEEQASMLSNNSFMRQYSSISHEEEEDSVTMSEMMEEEEEEEEVDKDFGEWFEPIEELILFDLLGIDYRERFEAMTLQEKKGLRLKVDNTEPKSKEEILAMLDEGESEQEEETLDHHEGTKESPKADSPIKCKKEKSRRLTLIVQNPPTVEKTTTKKALKAHSSCRTPLRSNLPSYLRPTSASAHRERTPQSTEKLRCPRLYEGHNNPSYSSPKQIHGRRLATGIDLSKVVSPVAQYIHSSPAPPLIRHVKSSRSKRLLTECAKENHPSSPAKEDYAPLPEANYKSSPLVTEQEMESDSKSQYKNCFSPSETVEPKIFRHLGRVKVPKSIQLNECGSENLENLIPSPSFSGSPCKMTLRKNAARESLGPISSNESMIDMSVHEVKTVRKLYDFEN